MKSEDSMIVHEGAGKEGQGAAPPPQKYNNGVHPWRGQQKTNKSKYTLKCADYLSPFDWRSFLRWTRVSRYHHYQTEYFPSGIYWS